MNRKSEDFFEELLRRASQKEQKQGSQDDIVIYYVTDRNGREIPVMERRNEIQFVPDPEDENATIPMTVSHVKYHTDDLGRPIETPRKVAVCKHGCVVRADSLVMCRWCKMNICVRHAFVVNKKTYCRRSFPCVVIGRIHQICRGIYRILWFCYRSILGQHEENEPDTYELEENLLAQSAEDEDISDEEMK